MQSNLLLLIRLRSNWRRIAFGPVVRRLTGERASLLQVQWCDGPQFPVSITHVVARSDTEQRAGGRGVGTWEPPPLPTPAHKAPLKEPSASGRPSASPLHVSFKSAAYIFVSLPQPRSHFPTVYQLQNAAVSR